MTTYRHFRFKNGNGQFEDWKIVDVFDHNNRKYIALIPVSDNADGENIHIHLMRLELTVQGGIEGCEVSTIPSDMEYDEVAGVFEKRVSEANENLTKHYTLCYNTTIENTYFQ